MFAYLLYCWPKVLIESLTSLTNTALSCCAFNIPRALTQLSCCHNISSPLSIITRVNPEERTHTLYRLIRILDQNCIWLNALFLYILLPQHFFTPINHYSSKSWGNNKHSLSIDSNFGSELYFTQCIVLVYLRARRGVGGGLHEHFPLIDWIESSAEKDSFFWREVILLTGASWVELSKRAGKTHFSRFSLFQKKKFWTDAWSINRNYDNWFIQVFKAR